MLQRKMAEEAEAEIVIEGGMLGVKKSKFSPLVNFSFEIMHFMENSDFGKVFLIFFSLRLYWLVYITAFW